MRSNFRLHSIVKSLVFISIVALAIFAFPTTNTGARSSGSPAGFTNAPDENNCAACHSDFSLDSGPGSLRVFGVPANYTPGQMVPINVQIRQGSALIVGFQLTSIWDSGPNAGTRAGTYTVTDAIQTQMIENQDHTRDYMEQTLAGTTPTGAQEKTWAFMWRAPATREGRI